MYIAYIYDRNKNIIGQFFQLLDVSITQTLNQQWNAQFRFRNDEIDFDLNILTPYNYIKINRLFDWNVEYNVFSWVLTGLSGNLDFTTVICRTFSHLLDRRLLTEEFISANESVDTIVNKLIASINSSFPSWISVDCWINTIVINKSYRFWQSIFSCLRDLAGQEYEFDVVYDDDLNLTLKFKVMLWKDKTSWPEYSEFRYDIADLSDANIIDIKAELDFMKIANAILAKSGTEIAIATDINSINEFWRLDQVLTNNWDVDISSQQELENRKSIQIKYDITPRTAEWLYYNLQLGDRVLVYINKNNPIIDFTGTMKIIWKSLTSWDSETETIKIWTFEGDWDDDIIADFRSIKNRVKDIEVKTA